MAFNTSLLREIFTITPKKLKGGKAEKPTIARSNRMVIALASKNGKYVEDYVVRTQNMHLCVRMAAQIFQEFQKGGPINSRINKYDWGKAWESICQDYERKYNNDRWVSIYFKGLLVFTSGKAHAFFNVIEQCNISNDGQYDTALPMAERVFKKAGKRVEITHKSNVAMIANFEDKKSRVNVILRKPDHATTFSFAVTKKSTDEPINIPQFLCTAAAFFEGIQISYLIGINNHKFDIGLIDLSSKEDKLNDEAKKRLERLDDEIGILENKYEVTYRSERPNLTQLINIAEKFGRKTIKAPPPPEEKKSSASEDKTAKKKPASKEKTK